MRDNERIEGRRRDDTAASAAASVCTLKSTVRIKPNQSAGWESSRATRVKPSHARLPIPKAGGPTARLESVHMLNSDARYVCSAGVCSFLGGRGANRKGCVRAGS